MTTEIPTWDECNMKVADKRDPLEQFIYENEPAADSSCDSFRGGLKRLVVFLSE